jgi:hypothetical protein
MWRMAAGWTRARRTAAARATPTGSVSADMKARVDRELYE